MKFKIKMVGCHADKQSLNIVQDKTGRNPW